MLRATTYFLFLRYHWIWITVFLMGASCMISSFIFLQDNRYIMLVSAVFFVYACFAPFLFLLSAFKGQDFLVFVISFFGWMMIWMWAGYGMLKAYESMGLWHALLTLFSLGEVLTVQDVWERYLKM